MSTLPWDPLQFLYKAPDNVAEAELPLRLLLIDDFSGQGEPATAPVNVRPGGLDQLLRERRIVLLLELPNRLLPDAAGPLVVEFAPQRLADFEPDALLERVPTLTAGLALLSELRSLKQAPDEDALAALALRYPNALLASLGLDVEELHPDLIDLAQADLAERLSAQLDEILHAPRFQALEAAWRGAALVLDQLPEDSLVQIDLLDLGKTALAADFQAHPLAETDFYQWVYSNEFGQYGGIPYAALICGYAFEPLEQDIALLRGLAQVAAVAHAPFVAAAGPRFLGAKRFEELSGLGNLIELHHGPAFAKWRGFVEEEASRYLALVLPRVLLRPPFDGRRAYGPLVYREDIAASASELLWGSAAYAFAGNLVRSFERFRVCVDIVGRPGGQVAGLTGLDGDRLPLEVLISEGKEAELVRLGLMPLVADRAEGALTFYAANSLHWAHVNELKDLEPEAELGLKLGAQLPYLFLVCRIAHYLKLIQRDTIGTIQSAAELQAELNGWLRRYVSDVENPEAAVRARRPLRRATLTVEQAAEGWYRMRLAVVPHVKYLGQDYTLSVDGRLGPG